MSGYLGDTSHDLPVRKVDSLIRISINVRDAHAMNPLEHAAQRKRASEQHTGTGDLGELRAFSEQSAG